MLRLTGCATALDIVGYQWVIGSSVKSFSLREDEYIRPSFRNQTKARPPCLNSSFCTYQICKLWQVTSSFLVRAATSQCYAD